MSKDTLTQCMMTQGAHEYVAFIPSKFAKRGLMVIIDGKPGQWTVEACYSTIDAAEANERSRDHANHRDFSDA